MVHHIHHIARFQQQCHNSALVIKAGNVQAGRVKLPAAFSPLPYRREDRSSEYVFVSIRNQ